MAWMNIKLFGDEDQKTRDPWVTKIRLTVITIHFSQFRNRTRPPRESYFSRALAEDTSHLDNYEVECGESRTERRRRNSAARTRETLDQLVQVSKQSYVNVGT